MLMQSMNHTNKINRKETTLGWRVANSTFFNPTEFLAQEEDEMIRTENTFINPLPNGSIVNIKSIN